MKQHRRPQYLEIYSRQYYNERVRDKVKAEIEDKGLTRNQVLSTIKRLTAETFEAESAELKKTIYAEAAAIKNANTDEPQSEEAHTPQSYAAYVRILCITACELTCECLQGHRGPTERVRPIL
jgi:hypothetical protein